MLTTAAQMYDPDRSVSYPYAVSLKTLREAVFQVTDDTPEALLPAELREGNEKALGRWLAYNVLLCNGFMCRVPTHIVQHKYSLPGLMLEAVEVSVVPRSLQLAP